jgi:phenylacetate-CoA ligase
VLLSVEAGFDRAGGEAIVAAFQRRLGASVEIDLQYVPNIEPEKSGKFRYVVSHVVASP